MIPPMYSLSTDFPEKVMLAMFTQFSIDPLELKPKIPPT